LLQAFSLDLEALAKTIDEAYQLIKEELERDSDRKTAQSASPDKLQTSSSGLHYTAGIIQGDF
jgi:hypothetical protein